MFYAPVNRNSACTYRTLLRALRIFCFTAFKFDTKKTRKSVRPVVRPPQYAPRQVVTGTATLSFQFGRHRARECGSLCPICIFIKLEVRRYSLYEDIADFRSGDLDVWPFVFSTDTTVLPNMVFLRLFVVELCIRLTTC